MLAAYVSVVLLEMGLGGRWLLCSHVRVAGCRVDRAAASCCAGLAFRDGSPDTILSLGTACNCPDSMACPDSQLVQITVCLEVVFHSVLLPHHPGIGPKAPHTLDDDPAYVLLYVTPAMVVRQSFFGLSLHSLFNIVPTTPPCSRDSSDFQHL